MKVSIGWILLSFLVSFAIIQSCRRANLDSPNSKLNEAKEWFYGTFRKMNEFKKFDFTAQGAKSPDWSRGKYSRIGSIEIFEFPLLKSHPVVSIPASFVTNEFEKVKIAEASISRILFTRKPGEQFKIVEADFIPTTSYLKTKEFDISDLSLVTPHTFSGRQIIKNWKGDIRKINIFSEGRLIKTGTILMTPKANRNLTEQCEQTEICEYERECTETWSNDVLISEECGPWVPTGFCWTEEYCEGTDDCGPGTSEEDCVCQLYGIGCPSEDPEECEEDEMQSIAESCINSEQSVSENIEEVVTEPEYNTGAEILRGITRKWTFTKSRFLHYHWSFRSIEKGVHKKLNNNWKWKSLNHHSVFREGTAPGDTDCEIVDVITVITPDEESANMTLDYVISFRFECQGVVVADRSKNGQSSLSWPVPD